MASPNSNPNWDEEDGWQSSFRLSAEEDAIVSLLACDLDFADVQQGRSAHVPNDRVQSDTHAVVVPGSHEERVRKLQEEAAPELHGATAPNVFVGTVPEVQRGTVPVVHQVHDIRGPASNQSVFSTGSVSAASGQTVHCGVDHHQTGKDALTNTTHQSSPDVKHNLQVLVPPDPRHWSREHISHWLQWAQLHLPFAQQLLLTSYRQLPSSGQQLCSASVQQLAAAVGHWPAARALYEHVHYLLRRVDGSESWSGGGGGGGGGDSDPGPARRGPDQKSPDDWNCDQRVAKRRCVEIALAAGGCGGQMWQFLLQLLETPDRHRHLVLWSGDCGQFRFVDPQLTASVWGQRKAKPAMNYDKFSRGLRYYYDKNILAKVGGQRFTYKFDFIAILRSLDNKALSVERRPDFCY